MRIALIPSAVLFFLAWPSPAVAWHKDGHMAVARVAWLELDDGQRAAIAKILKSHPHYALYLTDQRPKQLSEPEWAFVRASTWSDWVRRPISGALDNDQRAAIKKEFDKPVWHYVNLPYVHPDETDKFDAGAIRKTILKPELDKKGEPRHVLAALKHTMKLLLAADTSDRDKAIHLCWVLHLVGDLHQPLHGTSLIASKAKFDPPLDPPAGDKGGNLLAVKRKAGDTDPMVLHFYWDSLLFSSEPSFKTVDAVVVKLLASAKYKRDQLPELAAKEFLAWAEESLELAKTVVYKGDGGFLKAASIPAKAKIEFGLVSGLDAPVLPEGYRKAAEAVAERRMVVAGYRTADQLRLVFKSEK